MEVVSYSYLLHTSDPWKWFHIPTYYIQPIHGSGFIFLPFIHTTNPWKWFHIPTFYTYNKSMEVVSYSYLLHTTDPSKWFHIPTYNIQLIHGSWFGFVAFTCQVNSYGHCVTVSSPNHTFSWAGLNKRLTSNSCTYFRL